MLATIHVRAIERYVNAENTFPAPPYKTWASAAATIQEAVDVANAGDVVVVTNGVYRTGIRLLGGEASRLVVTQALTIRSVNGPLFTSIVGAGGDPVTPDRVACAYLGEGVSLSGFTITKGHGFGYPSGVKCASMSTVVSNCIITRNSTVLGSGGGAYGGTLVHCVLSDNFATYGGGGVAFCNLNNCTLQGNSTDANFADYNGGGAISSILNSCTLSGNVAFEGGGGARCSMTNCILFGDSALFAFTPYPEAIDSYVIRCWLGDPKFVNAAAGDLHLRADSPCINAGRYVPSTLLTDLDGLPRVAGGTIDFGAYEFQTPASTISYAWMQRYGLAISPNVDTADPDGDGSDNFAEWRAGTDPTNALSILKLDILNSGSAGVTLSWLGASSRVYSIERSYGLGTRPGFGVLQSNLFGFRDTMTITDTNTPGLGPYAYRVSVQSVLDEDDD